MFRRFLQSWLIDSVLILGIIVGAIVFFRPDIIQSLIAWIEGYSHILETINQFLNTGKKKSATIFTPLNIAMVVGGIGLMYILVWRTLWRLRRNQILTSQNCPNCNFPMHRVNRTAIQKVLSKMVPLRRYYCKKCKKKHVRIKPFYMESNDPESHARVNAPERINIGYSK